MASDSRHFPLEPVSDDLSPLPAALRQGLAAVAVLAALSFISSTAVLLYLTVKLARWHLKTWRELRNDTAEAAFPPVDLSLGLAERHFMAENSKTQTSPIRKKKAHPNQFLVLIYNLLLADIHQAASFLLNAVWVARDGIQVRTTTCWAQGWLVQTGDLAGSLFITAIAVHTYLAVVWNYTPPQAAVYAVVVGLWGFNYLLIILGLGITGNGREAGGFFVRAVAWCWINIRYEGLRLYLHYLWIFIALAITTILYTLIFLSLRKRRQPTGSTTTTIHDTNPLTTTPSSTSTKPPSSTDTDHEELTPSSPHHPATNPPVPAPAPAPTNHHPKAFLLYPLIYIACTAPLALGRIASMAGHEVPVVYFCVAGALITSNGWLDVLLWGVTRHRLLFGADGVDREDSGLDTFAFPFVRTPAGRRWGNIVWVEGGGGGNVGDGSRGGGAAAGGGGKYGSGSGGGRHRAGEGEEGEGVSRLGGWVKRRMGWRPLLGLGSVNTARGTGGAGETASREGHGGEDGLAIQMDMVTTVVIEPAAGVEGKAWDRGRGMRAVRDSG